MWETSEIKYSFIKLVHFFGLCCIIVSQCTVQKKNTKREKKFKQRKEKLNCGNVKGSREANLISMVTSSSTIKQVPCLEYRHAIEHESHVDAFL